MSLAVVQSANAADGAFEMVVLHTDGAPYKRGAVIDGNRPLELKAGWAVTLVGFDGSFVTLKGPSITVPAKLKNSRTGNPKITEALSALLGAEQRSTTALGVLRSASADPVAPLPDAWAVSVERSGVGCVGHDIAVLWRSNARRAAKLTVKRAGGARSARAIWPADQELLALNGTVFRDGEKYAISVNGQPVQISMRVMPRGLSGAAEQAAWMAGVGCTTQALALVDRIR